MIGKVVNNYKIISEIGQGGMGVVYRAYDSKLDRYVAIKILKSKPADPLKFIQRFKREAKNQAQLSHPNIVPVYDFLEMNGTLGIVMEFIEGETLEHVIQRKQKLDVYESIFIIKQVLKAIDYAHSKGFVHRDIKPSNIIISVDGIAKIMDFGISRSTSERGVTETGKNVGTLFYMSPEQIYGENPTAESDIYSLGITLYEMLTGNVPFQSDNDYEVFEGHLKNEPPDMLRFSPELPSGIVGIVYTALQKKAANRYRDAKEFYAHIEELESELLTGISQKPSEKRHPDKKYKMKAILYSTIIIIAAAALVYFIASQVLVYWKSGKDFFALPGKQVLVLDSLPVKAQKKLDCRVLNSGVKNALYSIYFLNDSTGFACGEDGIILNTTNSGENWIIQDTLTDKNLLSIFFNVDGRGFCVGEHSSIFRTEDYGRTWTKIDLNIAASFIKVKFIDNLNVFILGNDGTIMKSTDKGDTWKKANTGSKALLYDIDFINAQSAYAVGWNGEIIKSSDGGDHWFKAKGFTTNYIKTIHFFKNTSGYAAGGSGDVFFSTNEGNSWEKQNLDFSDSFNDIEFIDENIGFLCGSKGKVLMTLNGGKNWIKYELKTFATLNDLTLTPSGKIFAVGVNGTIIKL